MMMQDEEEPFAQKMYRVLWRALLGTREVIKRPSLRNMKELESMLELELLLLETHGNDKQKQGDAGD